MARTVTARLTFSYSARSYYVLWAHNNALNGTLPEALFELASLQKLSLWGNELSGTVPEALSELASLRWLWLYNNRLSGRLPSGLGRLQQLELLYLHTPDFRQEILRQPAWGQTFSCITRYLTRFVNCHNNLI